MKDDALRAVCFGFFVCAIFTAVAMTADVRGNEEPRDAVWAQVYWLKRAALAAEKCACK